MDRVPSNFALSTSFPQQIDVSRGSIVTVVIDENIVRMTSSSVMNENDVRVVPTTTSASNGNGLARGASFEMATSFSIADDPSLDDGAKVSKYKVCLKNQKTQFWIFRHQVCSDILRLYFLINSKSILGKSVFREISNRHKPYYEIPNLVAILNNF